MAKAAAAARQRAAAPDRPDYRRACAVPRPGHAACLALVRTNVAHHLQPAAAPHAAPTGVGYGPASLQSAYTLPSSSGGEVQTVAIVDAYNDPDAASDLATYRSAWGLPACGSGCFSVVNENGAASPLPANAAGTGWDVEESLDVDMASAACPLCHIILVEANSASYSDLGTGVNSAVALGAKYVSNSYGGADSSSDSTFDAEYYNHPGVAITASAGDGGYGVEYPAASQYVTAVGGTSLSATATGRGWTESAWGSSGGGEGTGSGCSAYEAKPSWQTDTGCTHRTVADVSADADPNTGVAVYDSYTEGGWLEVGGTSASSPLVAGTFALAGAPATGTYPSSYPYSHTSSLYDVTSGANGSCSPAYLCTAGTGYDGPTGWGTPHGVTAFSGTGTSGGFLRAGQTLHAGQALNSPGGQYTLSMQTDGNLVAYGNNCVIWNSGTEGTGSANYVTMQADGNLVVYTSAGKAVWASGRANADRLCTAGTLLAGQALYSPGAAYYVTMQTDGNLVVYTSAGKALWSSGTYGTGTANVTTMQSDGNLVNYTGAYKAVWASGTAGTGSGNYLVMQDDGNLVVYTSAGKAVWSSGT